MHIDRVSSYRPVIIIGAARSGTNMLRDILTQLPGFGTWPCDEINYIWRHGNMREATDEFNPELATEPVQVFIRKVFDRLAKRQTLSHVVEKTCANSLRVGFVNRIFPDALFIHIVRDGRDVVVSAQKRWTAALDLLYILRKARFVPVTDVPYYASRYLWNRLYYLASHEHRLAFWGPRFEGLEQALERLSLAEVCAIQWQRCVDKARRDFERIDSARVYQFHYEDFVEKPDTGLQRLGTFLGLDIPRKSARMLAQNVTAKRIGLWKMELDQETLESVVSLIEETLTQYGYR